jgi:long-chain acyl-CoA synthetase
MYGATEMAPIATAIARHERFLGTARALTVGHPVVGVELVIVDEFGAPVEAGSIGEIAVRGENVMLGYWENPDETAAVLRDGWYHSGDLGYVDASGLVYVADRKKDVIISGGENVYCAEVETVLAAFPGVQEAAVVARPDARWGEIVHAVVVADDDLDPAALLAHCREHLAGYKVPKSVELRSEPLPRSGAGKVLKRALR